MTWIEWWIQVSELIAMVIVGVSAVLLSFVGGKAIAGGDRGAKSWSMAIGGIAVTIGFGSFHLATALALRSYSEILQAQDDRPPYKELALAWKGEGTPEEQEKRRLHFAKMAFIHASAIVNYADRNGVRITYLPTAEDIQAVIDRADAHARTQTGARQRLRASIEFLISGVVALLVGIHFGRSERRSESSERRSESSA